MNRNRSPTGKLLPYLLRILGILLLAGLPQASGAQAAAEKACDRFRTDVVRNRYPEANGAVSRSQCLSQIASSVDEFMRRNARKSDTTLLRRVQVLTLGVESDALFGTALSILADTKATTPSRLVALHIALIGVRPGVALQLADWNRRTSFGSNAFCTSYLTDSPYTTISAEVAKERVGRALQVVAGVVKDSATPPVLRVNGECVALHLEHFERKVR